MPVSETASVPNQIAFPFMEEMEAAVSAGAGAAAVKRQGFAGTTSTSGVTPVLAGVGVAGAVLIAFAASGSAKPLLFALLAMLAMFGAFFLFALLAGHVRLGVRVSQEDLIRSIPEGLDVGVMVATRDGTPLYSNQHYIELAGSSANGEASSLSIAFACEPAASPAIYRLSRAASRGESRTEEFELQGSRAAGRRLMRVSIRPIKVRGQEREVGPLVLWTLWDVTGERAAEAATLRRLQTEMALFDKVPAGVAAVSHDGSIMFANAAFSASMGIGDRAPPEKRLNLADYIGADNLELLRGVSRRPGGEPAVLDLDIRASSGRLQPMRFRVRQGEENALLISAIQRDETDTGEGYLSTSEGLLSRFLQSAPLGIATLSQDGRIVMSNASFTRMTADNSSGIGETASDALCRSAEKATRAAFDEALKQVLSGRAQPQPVEITVGESTRRVYLAPLSTPSGAKEAAILYVIDATEHKALEAKFAQSSKMEAVGKLAGGIAHDFNNVLTAIIGFSDLLLQTHRPADPAYKDIMNIRSSANRAAGLVAKLLAFSRRQTLQSEPLQLGEVITDLAPLLNRSIGEKIELKIPGARDLWYVKADKTQFEQVVINLAVNARDAMPDGGTLSIRTRNVTERESIKHTRSGMIPGEYVLIEVEDTGTGMSKEVLEKIFEPFFTTKGVGKGTGLGLATVYGIVKQSGGYIYAHSTEGQGTTFQIYLPRHVPEADEELPSVKPDQKPQTADLTGTGRVLLVEDEDVVRSFAVRALKRQGYEVLEASSGVEALEVMDRIGGAVDIVVSDVVMPEMDGPTLLKNLRRQNPHLKIIFVSGYPHEAFETSLDKDQQFAFLPKPFSLPQLAAKVKEQLGR